MLRSLNSAITGLQNFQEKMDVIGNNIANVNTVGYKSAHTEFADTFSETLRASTGGGRDSIQIGSGVSTASIHNNFGQGSLYSTGRDTDLMISGDGFFRVKDKDTQNEFLTRAGDFSVDSNGYLTTNSGERVQGYTAGNTVGDIKIENTGNFHIDENGKVTGLMPDGTTKFEHNILIQTVTAPQMLVKQGNNLYSNDAAAGTSALTVPGSNGAGGLRTKALELSNVDLSTEFTDLITTQRAFQATAKMITTSDEMLQELVNMKR